MNKEKGHSLAPAELVILHCLAEAKDFRLINKKISEESKKFTKSGKLIQTRRLSECLKSLQKLGLIYRDIDTREYVLTPQSMDMLGVADILNLLQDCFRRSTVQGFKRAGIAFYESSVIFSEDPKMFKFLNSYLRQDESIVSRNAMSNVQNIMDGLWRKHNFEALDVGQRELIEEYNRKIVDSVRIIRGPSDEEWQRTRESLRSNYEKELEYYAPGISTLDEFIEARVENQLEQIKWSMLNVFLDQGELSRASEEFLESDEEIPKKTRKKLLSLMEYLDDPKNSDIYYEYQAKSISVPKTVIIFPSLGFRQYVKKYWEIFPEKREYFKKSKPWLYERILKMLE